MGECIHIYIYTMNTNVDLASQKDPLLRVVCWQYLHILNFSTSPTPSSCIIDLLNDFEVNPSSNRFIFQKGVCALCLA